MGGSCLRFVLKEGLRLLGSEAAEEEKMPLYPEPLCWVARKKVRLLMVVSRLVGLRLATKEKLAAAASSLPAK